MLKRLISLLLAAMLLLGASALADKNVNELIENACIASSCARMRVTVSLAAACCLWKAMCC